MLVIGDGMIRGTAVDSGRLAGFPLNAVVEGDCRALIPALPDESIDIVISSPPYWGQRTSAGNGVEADPRRAS